MPKWDPKCPQNGAKWDQNSSQRVPWALLWPSGLHFEPSWATWVHFGTILDQKCSKKCSKMSSKCFKCLKCSSKIAFSAMVWPPWLQTVSLSTSSSSHPVIQESNWAGGSREAQTITVLYSKYIN